MTAEQFAYWFQGFVELNGSPPTEAQWQSIREHLQTVFQKVTPPVQRPLEVAPAMPAGPLWPYKDPLLDRTVRCDTGIRTFC